ncbi:MAG: hypothetical protein WBB25_01040 [Sulfitobacter sp.]
MSKSIKLMAIFGLVAAVSACTSGQTEEEYVVAEPISVEPVYTGKYK